MLCVMNQTADPVRDAVARYSAAAHDKDVDAFVALYADDVHVFDMWNSWELRGIDAWRNMAAGWFSSLGDERVVVRTGNVWEIFHEHTSGPIDHETMKGVIKRGGS